MNEFACIEEREAKKEELKRLRDSGKISKEKFKKNELIKKYLQYTNSEEAYAVLFVKKYLENSKGKWVDIIAIKESSYFDPEKLQFRGVLCELFERKITPKYPSKKAYEDEKHYILACRAITWETAHEDIQQQRDHGIHGLKFIITGIKYNANKSKSFFVDNAPAEIKALEENINDRTNPLWDYALKYRRPEKWVFKIKNIVESEDDWI